MNSGGLNPAQRRVMPGTLQAFHEDVVAGVSPAVEGGVPPPGTTPGWGFPAPIFQTVQVLRTLGPPGGTPGSTAGRMPAATKA